MRIELDIAFLFDSTDIYIYIWKAKKEEEKEKEAKKTTTRCCLHGYLKLNNSLKYVFFRYDEKTEH